MWSDPIYDKITDCEIYFLGNFIFEFTLIITNNYYFEMKMYASKREYPKKSRRNYFSFNALSPMSFSLT